MKHNLKRIIPALLTALMLVLLTACGSAQTDSTGVDQDTQNQLIENVKSTVNTIMTSDDTSLDQIIAQERSSKVTVLADGIQSWKDQKAKWGDFQSIDKAVFSEVDDGYLVNVSVTCSNRKGQVLFGVDRAMQKATQLTFNMTETLGEKLKSAGINLVVGMIVVFAVLIFIAWIISLFKYINVIDQKMKKRKAGNAPAPVAAPAAAPVAAAAPAAVQAGPDDRELVAVITAAIAASTGKSPEGLVVRSIRKAGAGKWKRA